MIEVVLKNGSKTTLEDWQKIYDLPVGSNKIGKFFSLEDTKIKSNLISNKKLVINELLMRVLDAYREETGVPCILLAFNRSPEKQQALINNPKFEAAVNSPHVVYMAADIDTVSAEDSEKKAASLEKVAKKLGIKIRVGYKSYLRQVPQFTFIHVDVCCEYYAKGKPYHSVTHPYAWEVEARW